MFGCIGSAACSDALNTQSRLLVIRATMLDQQVQAQAQAQVREDRWKIVVADKLKVKEQKLVQAELDRAARVEVKRNKHT